MPSLRREVLADGRHVLVRDDHLELLANELAFANELDARWALLPLSMERADGRERLILDDPGGEPLAANMGVAWDTGTFLRFAASLAGALAQLHERGIVHRGLVPEAVFVDLATGSAWLTDFGRASRRSRERHAMQASVLAGRSAWLAPEQTGRFNRSIDHRVDLYALGLVLYRLITGALPFGGEDNADWIKSHVTQEPVPARARIANLPAVLSDILSRLLAKEPEDRYQTASSVEADLRRCLGAWDEHGTVESFTLSSVEAHPELLVSERVRGRDGELSILVGALAHVADTERPRLVLVDAPPGTGKSVFVAELDRHVVQRDGLFVRGKADQHDDGKPLAVLGRALADLGEALQVAHESRLAAWREAVQGISGVGVLRTHAPALAHALGPLPPSTADGRLVPVALRLFRLLGRRQHPLVVFVDDLQWVDVATLELLEELVASTSGAVLVIVAHRSGEAGGGVERLRKAARDEPIAISLAPLTAGALGAVVSDTLRRDASSLASTLHEKSGGNPFFAIQLLLALGEDGLLAFSTADRGWRWDDAVVRAHESDIATLVAGRIRRLPALTRALVEELACLGATASARLLGRRRELAETEVHTQLREAVDANIVRRDGATYVFAHDRVQEAAYGLLSPEERGERHLAIGRRLVADLPPSPDQAALALALGQMNRVLDRIDATAERARIAELDLLAGRHAMAAMAYAAADDYLSHAWTLSPMPTFELGLLVLESATLAGRPSEALFVEQLGRARDDRERGLVHALRIQLDVLAGRSAAAVERAFAALASLGVELDDVATARARVTATWAERPIASLRDLPTTEDARALASVEIIAAALPAAWLARPEDYERLAIAGVELVLRHGNTPRAPEIYVAYVPLVAIPLRFELADVAAELAERLGDARTKSAVAQVRAGQVDFWRHDFPDANEAVNACLAAGNLVHAGIAAFTGVWQRVEAGDPLPVVRALLKHFTALLSETRSPTVIELLALEDHVLAAPTSGARADGITSSMAIGRALESLVALVRAVHDEALDVARDLVAELPATLNAHPMALTFELYRGIATGDPEARERLAAWAADSPRFQARVTLLDAENARRSGDPIAAMRSYANAIELARKDGPLPLEALACARLASLQRELGLERGLLATTLEAAGAYRRWGGLLRAAHLEARHVGASAVEEVRRLRTVAALDAADAIALESRLDGVLDPDVVRARLVSLARDVSGGATIALAAPDDPRPEGGVSVAVADEHGEVARLDLVADGSDRGDLGRGILELLAPRAARALRHADYVVTLEHEARARAESEATVARYKSILDESQRLSRTGSFAWKPEGTHYIHWSGEMNRIFGRGREDAWPTVAEMFERIHPDDVAGVQEAVAYAERHASVLSFTHRFVHDDGSSTNVHVLSRRIQVGDDVEYRGVAMDITESQRARDALEKALGEVRRSQDRLRDIVDAIPALAWRMRPDGHVEFFNQRWLDYTGMRLTEAEGSGWFGALHPEDRFAVETAWQRFLDAGFPGELEARLRRRDGAYRWFLFRVDLHRDESGGISDWYGVNTDIEDRKLAERELQRAQSELAQAARAVTIGELATSIAHEINQPIGAMVADANAGLNWLAAGNEAHARASLEAIARDGERASDVVKRVRAHMARMTTALAPCDVALVVRAAIAVVRPELVAHGASVEAELGDEPLVILADPSQLQQLVVNLVTNAAEATREVPSPRRRIGVRLGRHGEALVLVIEDEGHGFSGDAARFFDAFYTTKPGGLGMGLTISRSIVERHAGRIGLEPNEAHGSTVRVTLPVSGS